MIEDVYLLAALRLAAGTDPAPTSVLADAEAAYAVRLPDARTAQPVRLPGPAGARAGDGPQLVRFAARGVTIDVEFVFCDGRVDVAGQVTGDVGNGPGDRAGSGDDAAHDAWGGACPGADAQARPAPEIAPEARPRTDPGAEAGRQVANCRIEVRTLRGSEVRIPSATGHFAATGLPPGWLSVACHRPGHAPVATRWLCVRE